jgi:hypothetical protein
MQSTSASIAGFKINLEVQPAKKHFQTKMDADFMGYGYAKEVRHDFDARFI